MPKPSITKRTTKGAALTYSELDTNFQNLADATLTITGGSTAVTADLNGNITLAAGSNVTITGNNTTKTITISSTGGGGTVTNPLSANLNLNGFTLSSGGSSNIKVDDDINFPSGTGPNVPGAGTLLCRGGNIELQYTGDPGLQLSGAIVSGTPSNTSTPAAWLKISVNGTTRYIPLYS